MKLILCIAMALASTSAFATNTPVPSNPLSTSSAASTGGTSSATAKSDALGGAGGLSSSTNAMSNDTNMYVLPAPIGGANLPAGMCQSSSYTHRAFVWNFISLADGQSHTDTECLKLLIQLEALRARPMPAPAPLQIMTAPTCSSVAAVPAPSKSSVKAHPKPALPACK